MDSSVSAEVRAAAGPIWLEKRMMREVYVSVANICFDA